MEGCRLNLWGAKAVSKNMQVFTPPTDFTFFMYFGKETDREEDIKNRKIFVDVIAKTGYFLQTDRNTEKRINN